MATATADTSQATLPDPLRSSHRTMGWGLRWTALLLALLGGWVQAQFGGAGDAAFAIAILIYLLAATAAVASWPLRWLRFPADAEGAAATLLKWRRLSGYLLAGMSAVVILLMIWLFFAEGLAAFPQFLSGTLFGLVGMVAGVAHAVPPGQGLKQEQVLQALVEGRGTFAVVLLVVGGILFLGGPILLYFYEWRTLLPEGLGALLLGLVFLSLGLWLLLSPPTEATITNMRVLVLSLGGLSGLIIALATALRVVLWRDLLFAEGIRSWQGEGAWRLWLCIYVELFGLGIMFGSLLLAQADIRTNATLRRLLYGYNAVLTGLLLLAILVVLNVLVYTTYPYTYDWRQTGGIYDLSDRSRNTLESLQEPTRVYVLMSQHTFTFQDTRNLLENAQAFNGRLQVEYLSPDRDPERYRTLARRYPKMLQSRGPFEVAGGRGLLVVYGPESEQATPPYVFIPESRLSEQKPSMRGEGKTSVEFHGEDVLMTELRFLASHERKPTVYFTQGHGELDINNTDPADVEEIGLPVGAGLLVERLKKDNYEVHSLRWGAPPKGAATETVYTKETAGTPHEIPKNAKVLVIAGPRAAYPKDVLDALKKYVDAGGKLVVLSNPTVKAERTLVYLPTGLEDLLGGYGVELGRNFIMRVPGARGDDPLESEANAPRKSGNPIALSFRDRRFLMHVTRTVRPAPGSSAFQAEPILQVSPEGQMVWAETDWRALLDPYAYLRYLALSKKLEGKESTEPLPVAVAVTDQAQKPRMVVFGDATLASNERANAAVRYYDLLTSSMEWLAERPGNIGIGPKTRSTFALRSPDISVASMRYLPLGLTMLTVLAMGTGVWVVRRR